MKTNYFIFTFLFLAVFCFSAIALSQQPKVQTPAKPAAPNVKIKYDTERQFFYIANADNGKLIKALPYKEVEDFSEGMAQVTAESGVGFINTKGVEVVPPTGKYKFVEDFSGGMAVVGTTNEDGERKTAGFINKTGAVIIPMIYQDAHSFSENMAAVKKNGKWGFINKSGTMVISPVYEKAAKFKYGLAPVTKKITVDNQPVEKCGYIDKTGKTIIPFKYAEAGIFHNTNPDVYEAIVEDDLDVWLINKKGEEYIDFYGFDEEKYKRIIDLQWVDEDLNLLYITAFDKSYNEKKGIYHCTGLVFLAKPEYREIVQVKDPVTNERYFYAENAYGGRGFIKSLSETIPALYDYIDFRDTLIYAVSKMKVENNKIVSGKYSLFNKYLEQLTKYSPNDSYDQILGFSEGLSGVQRNGKYGFINKKGEEVIALEYEGAGTFFGGLAPVVKEGKVGAINMRNEVLIPFEYNYLTNFSEGVAVYVKDSLWGIIDAKGKRITEPVFENMGTFSEGFAPYQKNKKIGYVNAKGEVVIQPVFDNAYAFSDSVAVVEKNQKFGFIDKKGNEIIPCKYDYSDGFLNGLSVVKEGEKYFLIDKKGKVIKSY